MYLNDLRLTNAADGEYIKMIRDAFREVEPLQFEAALAYSTSSGVMTLLRTLSKFEGWQRVRKRWLIGIDYCRSDPFALEHLQRLPRSKVRIHDGAFVANQSGCTPRVSYHPKLYLIQGQQKFALVLGSGNLSYTGLRVGIEAGISIIDERSANILLANKWFSNLWKNSCPWTQISKLYCDQYSSHKNRRSPMVLEDDVIPESALKRGQITPEQIRQLRVCQHLWVEAGNLHKNRGIGMPGNQLMLKRNTRVFFGFPAEDLPRDSAIGHIEIEFNRQVRTDCSIRFSNNAMDVLTLPIPNSEGPPKYDQETLCFTQIDVRKFRLEIGKTQNLNHWKRRSRMINGAFKMNSGRRWGVY